MSEDIQADKRIQKTLTALREAFFELVLSYSYDEIKVSDIIRKADIGRSTFYQHYKSKDDILTASMHFPLMTLAQTVDPDSNQEDLLWLMEHFWENRKFAPRIFSSNARRHIIGSLTNMISTNLQQQIKLNSTTPLIPIPLAAHQLAEAQMTMLIDWMLGKGNCTPKAMANHVELTSNALCKLYFDSKH